MRWWCEAGTASGACEPSKEKTNGSEEEGEEEGNEEVKL
jgi:hypothetical protein